MGSPKVLVSLNCLQLLKFNRMITCRWGLKKRLMFSLWISVSSIILTTIKWIFRTRRLRYWLMTRSQQILSSSEIPKILSIWCKSTKQGTPLPRTLWSPQWRQFSISKVTTRLSPKKTKIRQKGRSLRLFDNLRPPSSIQWRCRRAVSLLGTPLWNLQFSNSGLLCRMQISSRLWRKKWNRLCNCSPRRGNLGRRKCKSFKCSWIKSRKM